MFNRCTLRVYCFQWSTGGYSSDVENDHNDVFNGQGESVFLVFSLLIQAPCVFELFQIVPYIIIKDQNPFSLSKRLPPAMLISTNPQNVFFFLFFLTAT